MNIDGGALLLLLLLMYSLAQHTGDHTIVVRRTNAITCLLSKTITINRPMAHH
jgi:hypothetical protein